MLQAEMHIQVTMYYRVSATKTDISRHILRVCIRVCYRKQLKIHMYVCICVCVYYEKQLNLGLARWLSI